MWMSCLSLTAVRGDAGALICKVSVTHYISSSPANNGATILNAVPKKTPPIKKKKKFKKQGYTNNSSQKERRENNSTRGYADDVRTDNVV